MWQAAVYSAYLEVRNFLGIKTGHFHNQTNNDKNKGRIDESLPNPFRKVQKKQQRGGDALNEKRQSSNIPQKVAYSCPSITLLGTMTWPVVVSKCSSQILLPHLPQGCWHILEKCFHYCQVVRKYMSKFYLILGMSCQKLQNLYSELQRVKYRTQEQ